MLGLWLTTIGGTILFFTTLYFFFQAIKNAVHPEDAYTIDKLPDEDSES